ncbi:MAG: type III-A CRISPR-associated RAMP protein Csm3 [Campylobacteraceae bacterium]|nr:type III-A CRISPR-associated RAMP protein Csm3 [Campylobacteraceae bacterium]
MKIVSIKRTIEVLTGLHIGGGDDIMQIGGIDNPVIKTAGGKPYIPGSSIKGKMRSLLEWKYDLVLVGDNKSESNENNKSKKDNGGKPFGSDRLLFIKDEAKKKTAETLIKLFGDSNAEASVEDKLKFGITRISVGDCYLSKEQNNAKYVEAKYENVIDRRSGTASNPRQSERVSAGVKFDFDIRIKVLEGDDENKLTEMVEDGISLIEQDYLGGSGSRGYGRVQFHRE